MPFRPLIWAKARCKCVCGRFTAPLSLNILEQSTNNGSRQPLLLPFNSIKRNSNSRTLLITLISVFFSWHRLEDSRPRKSPLQRSILKNTCSSFNRQGYSFLRTRQEDSSENTIPNTVCCSRERREHTSLLLAGLVTRRRTTIFWEDPPRHRVPFAHHPRVCSPRLMIWYVG